jgi:hypothetical protein
MMMMTNTMSDITEIINRCIEESRINTEEEKITSEQEIINRSFISSDMNNNENY